MTQIESYSLLIIMGFIAIIITDIANYFNRCAVNYKYKKYEKGAIYRKKIEKLHDNAFYYYYDMMNTDPIRLAYDLASRDINRVKHNKMVDYMYKKMKEA